MKTSLVTCACALLLVVSVWAIPQTFQQGPNLFAQRVGMSFEQFASEPAAWEGGGAALKGTWQTKGDTLTLTDSASVFGVAADEITAQQQDGRVQSFRVVFRASEKKKMPGKPADLSGQLKANMRAFTGEEGQESSAGLTTFKYKAVTITLRSVSGHEVVVEFKRG
jgi:hypothetical protein